MPKWQHINIASSNGLTPNKLFPKPMTTKWHNHCYEKQAEKMIDSLYIFNPNFDKCICSPESTICRLWSESQFRTKMQHTEALGHIYASVNWVIWQWLITCLAPSHYLNQYWLIVTRLPGTNFNENSIKKDIFNQTNIFKNVVCKMAAIYFHLCPPAEW